MMGIQTKLTGPVLIAFLFFTSMLHLYWGPKQYEAAKVDISKQLQSELASLDHSLIRYLLENNYAALYAALKELDSAHQGKWKHLTLFDDNQKKIYPLFPEKQKNNFTDYYINHTHPIILEGEQLGIIHLHVDLSNEYIEAQNRIYEIERYLISTGLVLIIFIIFWQYLIIIKPVKYLQRAVEFMKNGNFSIPIREISHDEIGQLTLEFDQMRQTITDSQQQLKQANDETRKAFEEIANKNIELHNEIGERIKIQDQLNRIATHDELTTLPNLYLLKQVAIKALSEASNLKHNVGILFIDLNALMTINEKYSHESGDVVLVEISIRISEEIRNKDIVGRVGGDEFVVILPECNSLSDLQDMARKIINQIKRPIESIQISEPVTACIGMTLFPHNGQDFDTLLHKAEAAMYQAKKQGKNKFHHYIENNSNMN